MHKVIQVTNSPSVWTAASVVRPVAEVTRKEFPTGSERMDAIRDFLTTVRQAHLVEGHFLGLLHVLVGRKITRTDGSVVSTGLTWRQTASYLRQLRFDPQLAREVNVDPEALNIRDRDRFWYTVIAQAHLDSPTAVAEADKLAPLLQQHGYIVGPPPSGLTQTSSRPATPPPPPSSPGSALTSKTSPTRNIPRKKKN